MTTMSPTMSDVSSSNNCDKDCSSDNDKDSSYDDEDNNSHDDEAPTSVPCKADFVLSKMVNSRLVSDLLEIANMTERISKDLIELMSVWMKMMRKH